MGVASAAVDPDRDFSGRWVLDAESSNVRALSTPPERLLVIAHRDVKIECASEENGRVAERWAFTTDREESVYKLGAEKWSTVAKWEGAALLTSALVSGPRDYSVMDRWRLSGDRATLTIHRQIVRGGAESEASLVYRREGFARAAAPEGPPRLVRSGDRAAARELVVASGAALRVTLVSPLSSRNSEGDPIYLETLAPVMVDGQLAIPRGSAVAARVVNVKRPGPGLAHGSVALRFETLTLPAGANYQLRAHLSAGDAARMSGANGGAATEGSRDSNARKVAQRGNLGANLGALAGIITGVGARTGQAAGAATGVGSVLVARGADLDLPKGTVLELTLDDAIQIKLPQ
jgi:hypothetical protein